MRQCRFREELLHGRAWPLRLVGSGSVLCAVKRGYTRTCKFLFTDCVCSLESYQSKFVCEKGGVECLHAKLAHELEMEAVPFGLKHVAYLYLWIVT